MISLCSQITPELTLSDGSMTVTIGTSCSVLNARVGGRVADTLVAVETITDGCDNIGLAEGEDARN